MRRTVATKWALGLGGVALAVAVPTTVAMASTSAAGGPPAPAQSGHSAGYGVMSEDCPLGLTTAERDQLREQVHAQVHEQMHEQMQLLLQQRAAS